MAEREGFEILALEVLGKSAKVTHIKILPDHPMSTNVHRSLWRSTDAGRILVAFATRALPNSALGSACRNKGAEIVEDDRDVRNQNLFTKLRFRSLVPGIHEFLSVSFTTLALL